MPQFTKTASDVRGYPEGYDKGFTFGNMLNDMMTSKYVRLSYFRDTYIWSNIKDKVKNWDGNPAPIAFEGGYTSNYQSGFGLIDTHNIQSNTTVRGTIEEYKQIFTAWKFKYDDVHRVKPSRVPQSAFYAQTIDKEVSLGKDNFMYYLNQTMLTGSVFLPVTALGITLAAITSITTDHPARVTLGQRLILKGVTAAKTEYVEAFVRGININTGVILLGDKMTGTITGPSLSLTDGTMTVSTSSYTTANFINALVATGKFTVHLPGDERNKGLTSIKSQVLPAAHGGSDTLFGLTKTDYPFLQSVFLDAAGKFGDEKVIGVLHTIHDFFTKVRKRGQLYSYGQNGLKGETGVRSAWKRGAKFTDILMSDEWISVFQKFFEATRADYFSVMKGSNINYFDAQTFILMGSSGTALRFVGCEGMTNDIMYIIGQDVFRFMSHNLIEMIRPHGDAYSYIRQGADNKPEYVVDGFIYGDLVVKRPGGIAAIVNLPTDIAGKITKYDRT